MQEGDQKEDWDREVCFYIHEKSVWVILLLCVSSVYNSSILCAMKPEITRWVVGDGHKSAIDLSTC